MTIHWKEFFEANTPEEEKNMFDMKTMPWKIYVNNESEFNAARGWLASQGYPSVGFTYPKGCKYLTNTDCMGRIFLPYCMDGKTKPLVTKSN